MGSVGRRDLHRLGGALMEPGRDGMEGGGVLAMFRGGRRALDRQMSISWRPNSPKILSRDDCSLRVGARREPFEDACVAEILRISGTS